MRSGGNPIAFLELVKQMQAQFFHELEASLIIQALVYFWTVCYMKLHHGYTVSGALIEAIETFE